MPKHTHKLSDCGAVTRSLIKFAPTHTHTYTHMQRPRLCRGVTGSGAHKSTQHFGSVQRVALETERATRQKSNVKKRQAARVKLGVQQLAPIVASINT